MMAPRRRGFTLVEMLVVIGIIVVLMAILFPVFAAVMRKARETQCHSNLRQLAAALKQYLSDHGRYPGPPAWNGTRYVGGLSDLYPDYTDNSKLLICPDDPVAKRLANLARDQVYCSYNGVVDPATHQFVVDTATGLPTIYYNYNGYNVVGNVTAQPFPSTGLDNGGTATAEAAWQAAILSDYTGTGLSLRDAPRLKNRSAPGNTIITHCISHRGNKPDSAQARDFIICVDSSEVVAPHVKWDEDPDGSSAKVAPWIAQRQ